ncbi:MAG: class I SAM-dependent methyltransferase, partial [Chloroflexota bacterium]
LEQCDMREFFPTSPNIYPVILASLTLHYFDWEETVRLVEDIHHALEPDGLFLMRVNSTEDVLYGATGYPEISHHFYQVEERTKRFFDAENLDQLISEDKWTILSQEKVTIGRYDRPKIAWELVLRKY